jgi:hypothetical protein
MLLRELTQLTASTVDEAKKRKRKARRTTGMSAAYGPGPYGGYGYYAGYSGDSGGGDGGGGGESIHELFDGGKDWKWTYQDKNQAMAAFTVGDVNYTFSAGQDPDEAPGDWDVEFAAKKEAGTASWGVTGTGNSAQVFGTVVEIMKAFIASKKASIRRMTFAAKEDSRQGLYARMVKRLLPKWNLEQNGEAFVLTRPGGLVFWVYSVEAPYNKIPAVKVKANSAQEAEQIVLTTMPEFKGADRMGMGASKNKPNLSENFADGRNPQDKGDAKRHGVPTKGSVSSLRKVAKQGGRKGQLAHWMANMKSGKAKKNETLTEAVIHPSTMDALQDFLPFVMKLLKLDKLPRISVHKTIETGDQPSFGGYNPEDGTIQLALKDRHPADVLRTLAHELVHFKQDQQGELDEQSGATGSNEENEANTKAGIIMRHFNKRFPQYLE